MVIHFLIEKGIWSQLRSLVCWFDNFPLENFGLLGGENSSFSFITETCCVAIDVYDFELLQLWLYGNEIILVVVLLTFCFNLFQKKNQLNMLMTFEGLTLHLFRSNSVINLWDSLRISYNFLLSCCLTHSIIQSLDLVRYS